MAKLNFQQTLLQSSMSHDPSEIILCWFGNNNNKKRNIINVENSCAV